MIRLCSEQRQTAETELFRSSNVVGVEEAEDSGPISGVQVAIGLPHCMQSKVNHHTSPSVRAEHAIGVVPKSKPKIGVGKCLGHNSPQS